MSDGPSYVCFWRCIVCHCSVQSQAKWVGTRLRVPPPSPARASDADEFVRLAGDSNLVVCQPHAAIAPQ